MVKIRTIEVKQKEALREWEREHVFNLATHTNPDKLENQKPETQNSKQIRISKKTNTLNKILLLRD
jgi:hypothetical protein